MDAEFPEKKYFKIGEVSRITALRPSVLRFWESEFKELTPSKSRSGQRIYTKRDLELVLEIKKLLYGEKLTIDGARNRLSTRPKGVNQAAETSSDASDKLRGLLKEIKEELIRFRNTL